MLKFLDMLAKGDGQGYWVKTFGMIGNASSQGMYTWKMNALPLMVQKLWQTFKFLEM